MIIACLSPDAEKPPLRAAFPVRPIGLRRRDASQKLTFTPAKKNRPITS
jgi:hypothetical protein